MVWRENGWRELTCPACQVSSLMPKRIDANPPYKPRERYALYQCENCGTLHYPDVEVFEYESRRDADLARKFYLEVGAGLDAMVAPLAWVGMDDTGSFLEVGGGYGFSVDFASRGLGWTSANIDPSFLARTGARDLGHTHIAAYLSPDHELADQSFDRVLSSEVIEHVKEPDRFLAALTAALAPDGVLLLTTPNAAVVKADAGLDALLPVITAGHHIVIYSKAGLETALRRAGYSHVTVQESGPTLQATASRSPFKVDFDAGADRSKLQAYLSDRLETLGRDHTLFAAFAVRLLKECVHTAQWDRAREIRDILTTRWLKDYGFNLKLGDTLNTEFRVTNKGQRRHLRRFAANHPFSLAIALYYSARVDQNFGKMADAISAFRAASRIANTLQSVFSTMYAACRETEEASLRARLALAELTAASHPDEAASILLEVLGQVKGLLLDEWQRIACHTYASGALTGRFDAVSRIAAPVRGHLEAKRTAGSGLSPVEGYAAGGIGESLMSAGENSSAASWYELAAAAMSDSEEKQVFEAKAKKANGQVDPLDRQLIDAVNSTRPETAHAPVSILGGLAATDPQISASVAFALGIYSLNIKPDPAIAAKWFARAAELSTGEDRVNSHFHLALAAMRLPQSQQSRILPDLIHQIENASVSDSDLGSRIDALVSNYKNELRNREATA
jgi:SAM-dependent methyltransferase